MIGEEKNKIQNPARAEVRPQEIARWEGEGGNPPAPAAPRKKEPARTIAGILRRLLIDWRLIHAPRLKS